MDILHEWSLKLAQCAAPDEVDLAASIARAFAAGGAQRDELFRRSGALPGGFGAAETVAMLPTVFRALSNSAPAVLAVLASGAAVLGGYAQAAKTVVEVRDAMKDKAKGDQPGENPYLPFKKAAQTLSREMQAAGVAADQSELITYRVLMALCEDPEGAGKFVGALHGPPGTS